MHLKDHEIALYADALRSNSENQLPPHFLEHVEECVECKSAILELVAIVGDIENEDEIEPAKEKLTSLRKTIYTYLKAAAVVVALALPSYFYISHNSFNQQKIKSPSVSKKLSTIKEEDVQELNNQSLAQNNSSSADLYTPIAEYEAVCGESYRSEKIDVISPSNSKEVKEKIKFDITFQKKGERVLKIFNNKDIEIFQEKLHKSSFTHEVSLPNGLYYWKLETTSDLLYLGKFTIRR